jgi:transposase
LAAQVQNVLAADPFSGALFVFRGKRGDILKILAWDGSGLCLYPFEPARSARYRRVQANRLVANEGELSDAT